MLCSESLVRLLDEDPGVPHEDAFIPDSPRGWTTLVGEALRQGVGPLLHRRLQSLGDRLTPPTTCVHRLQVVYVHNALRQRTALDELRRVLLAFRRDDVRVALLKGAHLATIVYGDPALRPMTDIDVLVAPMDLTRAECALRSEGYGMTPVSSNDTDYATHRHVHPFDKPGALPIELHRSLTSAGAPFDLDLEALWRRTRSARVAGVEALVLSSEDLMQHLCVHAAYNHRFDVPLLAIHDIHATVEHARDEMDWRSLAATANADGTSRVVYCALSIVQAMFRTPIPASALSALHHTADDLEVVAAAHDRVLGHGAVELPAVYRTLRGGEGFARTVGAVARGIWPSRPRMRAIYELAPGSPAVYAYYAIRPFDLLRRRGRVVAGMLLQARSLRPTVAREAGRRVIDRWIDRIDSYRVVPSCNDAIRE